MRTSSDLAQPSKCILLSSLIFIWFPLGGVIRGQCWNKEAEWSELISGKDQAIDQTGCNYFYKEYVGTAKQTYELLVQEVR